jgi:hypothetical protein
MASETKSKEQLREEEFIKKGERVPYDNRCVIWYNPDAKKKKWIVEHPGPPERTRNGFPSLKKAEEAIGKATDWALGDAEAPISVLENDARLVLRQFAQKLNGASKEYKIALHGLAALNEEDILLLHRLSGPLAGCVDRHKAEELLIRLLDTLRQSRTHITMGHLVDSFIKNHRENRPDIASHVNGQEIRQPLAGHNQLVKVGKLMITAVGREYDLDLLTDKDVDKFKAAYFKDCIERTKKPPEKSTISTKLRQFNQILNYGPSVGWKGKFRANFVKVTKSKPEVALNFDELSGMIMGLLYTHVPTCRAFTTEVFGLLRFIEVRQLTWRNLWRANHKSFIGADATKATSILSQRGKDQNPNNVGKSRFSDMTYVHFQWQTYYREKYGEPGETVWSLSKPTWIERINEVRKLVGCKRWSEKDCGRHTGVNILREFGIPDWKIQLLLGHPIGSDMTMASYGAEILDVDACASLLITPFSLGLIPEPYPYFAPESDPLHLGHQLILNPQDDVHRAVIDAYLPRLHARHEEVKKLCGVS